MPAYCPGDSTVLSKVIKRLIVSPSTADKDRRSPPYPTNGHYTYPIKALYRLYLFIRRHRN